MNLPSTSNPEELGYGRLYDLVDSLPVKRAKIEAFLMERIRESVLAFLEEQHCPHLIEPLMAKARVECKPMVDAEVVSLLGGEGMVH